MAYIYKLNISQRIYIITRFAMLMQHFLNFFIHYENKHVLFRLSIYILLTIAHKTVLSNEKGQVSLSFNWIFNGL